MNIVIIGKSTHSDYAEVRQLACILSENHAHFSYKAVSYCPKRYKRILRIFNEIYKWDHVDPVLIFRHQGFPGGPVEYIGNIDQFHEFIYEYYGERRLINKCEAEKYIGTHLKEKRNHKYIRRSERNFKRRYTHVSIIGAGYNVEATEFLVYQLIKLKEIHNKDGIRIRLYDFDKYKQIELRNIIRRISFIEELVEPFTPVTVAKKIENAITTCDFLFLTGDVNRNEKLTTYETVKINQYIFTLIGQVVDIWASPNIKIILMNMDHLCFNANVLTDNLSKVPANNVVCVTQHLGVEPIGYISLATGIPAVHINNGFVWGFIGFSHLIDMKQTTVLFNQFKFTKRGSDLNFTESKINKKNYPYKIAEDRWIHRPLASVINNLQYIWYYVGTRKEYVRKVTGHSNYVSTVRMALELVKIWKCGLNQNACICVGVPSDKTYGFPRHMFISQPCKLINNKWKPFENFPIPNDIIDFEDIVLLASSLLKLCKVGASIYPKCKWLRDIAKRRRKDQKFDTYEVKKAEQILLGVTTDELIGSPDERDFVYNEEGHEEPAGNLFNNDYFKKQMAEDFGETSEGRQIYFDDLDFDEIRRLKEEIYRDGGRWAEVAEKQYEENEEEAPLKKKKKEVLSSSEESLSINTVDTEEDGLEALFQESLASTYSLEKIESMLYHPLEPFEDDDYNLDEIFHDLLRDEEETEPKPSSSSTASPSTDELGYLSKSARESDEESFKLDMDDEKEIKEPPKQIKNIKESHFELPPYTMFWTPKRYGPHETDELYKARKEKNILDHIRGKEKYALRNEDIEDLSDSVVSINPDLYEDKEEYEEEIEKESSSKEYILKY